MCGIVGYVGSRPAQEIILGGLRKLEYRGYDSAGMSLLADGEIQSVRAVGNLDRLEAALAGRPVAAGVPFTRPATIGIGHTRWATHGAVNEQNAHPLVDGASRIHVVVNGIVGNYMALKDRLLAEGTVFATQTDAEVIAHLIAGSYHDDLARAVIDTLPQLEGYFAFVAMVLDEPDVLVGARRECPLVVGRGDGESFIASAVPAFLSHTNHVQYVENGEIVILGADSVEICDAAGVPRERAITTLEWDEETAEKGGYDTFMRKEIDEQPQALAETIADRTARGDGVDLQEPGAFDEDILRGIERVAFVSCGTSYHAGMLGRYALEEWARIATEVDVASEYRYRNPILGPTDLVVGISQSGETADTLAAMRLARERGARVLALTNTMGSQATRDSDAVLFTRAGLEIGVAATKTFVCQIGAVYLLALRLAELRGTLPAARIAELTAELRRLPTLLEELLERVGPAVEAVAESCWDADFFLYIGRQAGLPIALEGALKLKEIAYISTDAYASGEMKHGPIAMLDARTPVVCVATASPVLGRILDNVETVRARGAKVLAITSDGDEEVARHVEWTIPVPATDPLLSPLLAVIPLQLLAYTIARRRGLNVDQPRNLAKTVTVE
ncbi:MAG: glutamine--fructose-6-phosphate transaminase (isomerizing) [Solirubrobacteraceae bacterium]|jgi:glucosamine--fructose-6-phosphate aminotransferase (isomerizing)